MKKLNNDIQKIYNFCEQHKNNLDKAAENTDDFEMQIMFTQQSTCYWAVQQFIEVNFGEN